MEGELFSKHLTTAEIEAGIKHVIGSPNDNGTLKMIVRRPAVGKREVLTEATLDIIHGLIGDNWKARGSKRTPDGSAHPEMQINLMNYRFAEIIAGSRERVPLAGDQLYVDLDLSPDNLPPGTKLAVGTAILEVTSLPHLGCKKFTERFGIEAFKYANSEFGRRHNLRGINARVVIGGKIITHDLIRKVAVD